MDEAKLRTVAQLQDFLNAAQEIKFTGAPGESDQQRYEHITAWEKSGYAGSCSSTVSGPDANANLSSPRTVNTICQ